MILLSNIIVCHMDQPTPLISRDGLRGLMNMTLYVGPAFVVWITVPAHSPVLESGRPSIAEASFRTAMISALSFP